MDKKIKVIFCKTFVLNFKNQTGGGAKNVFLTIILLIADLHNVYNLKFKMKR